jgi:hypothetical protein
MKASLVHAQLADVRFGLAHRKLRRMARQLRASGRDEEADDLETCACLLEDGLALRRFAA